MTGANPSGAFTNRLDVWRGERERMYPYTLLPDGHTLEPEDVVKPPANTAASNGFASSWNIVDHTFAASINANNPCPGACAGTTGH